MNTQDHLVYMLNQIARNLAIKGDEKAAIATADHIEQFWDPRMKQMIRKTASEGDVNLSKISLMAVQKMLEGSDVG
jgi:formate dehydrogenase subunit delta